MRLARGAAWLLGLALLLSGVAARAQAEIDLSAGDRHDLRRAFEFLVDEDGKLGIAEVAQPARAADFRRVPQAGPAANFGLTPAAIWLKVRLRTAEGGDPHWLLEIAYPPLDHLEVYSPDEKGGFERHAGGDALPYLDRPVPHRNHVVPVNLPPGRESTIYLRIRSEGTVSAPATLWRPAALWKHDQGAYASLSLYFGLLLGLALYNLLLFVSVRDIAYLYYVGFVAALGVGQAGVSSFSVQ